MYGPIPSRALLRSLAAGALVLAGATACSRSDRSDSGDNSASMAQDTASITPDQSGSTAGRDTATGVPTDAPRAATVSPAAERSDTSMTADSAAGYRAMDRDTATAPSDTGAVESSSAPVGAAAAVGATAAMARDTSTIADQTDTPSDTAGTLQASVDTSHNAEPSDSGHAGAVLAAGAAGAAVAATAGRDDAGSNDETDPVAMSDTAGTLQASVDTSHYSEPSDSSRAGAVVAAGAAGAAVAAAASRDNDAAPSDGPTRPPEDSTEILGNVTSYETADEEPVNASEQVTASVNRTDEVGAAAVGGTLTGADAVGLMTRQGVQCSVVAESDEVVRWDMASTPATLNPCGLGSMNLSKVFTAGPRGRGAAGP